MGTNHPADEPQNRDRTVLQRRQTMIAFIRPPHRPHFRQLPLNGLQWIGMGLVPFQPTEDASVFRCRKNWTNTATGGGWGRAYVCLHRVSVRLSVRLSVVGWWPTDCMRMIQPDTSLPLHNASSRLHIRPTTPPPRLQSTQSYTRCFHACSLQFLKFILCSFSVSLPVCTYCIS